MRKVFDRQGRNWQTVAFVRPVSPAELAAVRRRRPLPSSLMLMDAATPHPAAATQEGGSLPPPAGERAPTPAADEPPPPPPEGAHAAPCGVDRGGRGGRGADGGRAEAGSLADLADAIQRLFAPEVAAARAVLAGSAGCAADLAVQTRAYYAEMARLLAGPQSAPPGASQ